MSKADEVAGLTLRCQQVQQFVSAEQCKTWLTVQVKFFEIMHEPAFAEACFQLWQNTVTTEKAQHDRQSAGGSPATTGSSASTTLASQLKCASYPNCECTDGCVKPYTTAASSSSQ
jgi:hypothetical protein